MFHVAVAKSTQSGLGGGLGNYEIRCNGTSEEGIFVRYSGSSYGKLGSLIEMVKNQVLAITIIIQL